MARYYFDLHECGHGSIVDDEGLDLPDIAAARGEAIKSARDVMMSEVAKGKLCLGCAIIIRDEAGASVTLPFAEAIDVTLAEDC